MAITVRRKQDFATRLSVHTLAQLDKLVDQGRFANRTRAIEAAVDRLYATEQRDPERLRRAFERTRGALKLGIDRESFERAEYDRLDWESARHAGRLEATTAADG
jgi:Arc/MetJ-type ribon-helix-helix transcriptional regulator